MDMKKISEKNILCIPSNIHNGRYSKIQRLRTFPFKYDTEYYQKKCTIMRIFPLSF